MTETNEDTIMNEEISLEETDETTAAGGGDGVLEELRAENEELKNVVRLQRARDEITKALAAADARSPGLLFAYAVDMLQFDDDGKLVNAAAITEHLKKNFPEQFGRPQPPSAIDGGAGASRPVQYLTKDALAKMAPAEVARLDWAEVRQVLSGR